MKRGSRFRVAVYVILIAGLGAWIKVTSDRAALTSRQRTEAQELAQGEDPHLSAHRLSSKHRALLLSVESAGCFHCLEIFPTVAISGWTDTSGAEAEQTALCPFCGIDSVIPGECGYPLSKEFLGKMKNHWF